MVTFWTLKILIKTGVTTQEEMQHLYQQMLIEIRQTNFVAWATK